MTDSAAAAREARQEAGVSGNISPVTYGSYRYRQTDNNRVRIIEVAAYILWVKGQKKRWRADEIVPVGDTADRSSNWRNRAGLVDRDLEMRSSDPPVISCGEVESLGRVPFFEIDKFRLSVSAEAFGRWPVGAEQS